MSKEWVILKLFFCSCFHLNKVNPIKIEVDAKEKSLGRYKEFPFVMIFMNWFRAKSTSQRH